MSIDALINKGQFFLKNGFVPQENQQFIIVGVARSGTSLVAGVLSSRGVESGPRSTPPVFEDVDLAEAFERKDLKKAAELIQRYNLEKTNWFFKRPKAIHYLDDIDKLVPNPIYIFIFKDVFSIALRNSISMDIDILPNMKKTIHEYEKIIDLIYSLKKPTLLISAQKVLEHKVEFVKSLASLIFHDVEENDFQSAIDFIDANSIEYLDKTRINKCVGEVQCFNSGGIRGWAFVEKKPSYKAIITLLVDGVIYDTVKADQDLAEDYEKKIFRHANCGFFFDVDRRYLKGKEIIIQADKDTIYRKIA